jgi:hypothetical protein
MQYEEKMQIINQEITNHHTSKTYTEILRWMGARIFRIFISLVKAAKRKEMREKYC